VSGCSSLNTPWGFPCCARFPGVHAIATTPVRPVGASSARFPTDISLPGKGAPVGPHIVFFEVCSTFTLVTACTLALPPYIVARIPKASTASLPPQLLRLLPAGASSPGGIRTRWKAPPFHGAHPSATVSLPDRSHSERAVADIEGTGCITRQRPELPTNRPAYGGAVRAGQCRIFRHDRCAEV